MFHASVFAICLVSTLAVNFVQCSDGALGSKFEVNFAQNLTDFLNANPDIQLQKLNKEVTYDESSSRSVLTYRIGSHVDGDRLLTIDSESIHFEYPQDVHLNLNYPKTGFAEIISYIYINAEQTSFLGDAYVIAGGIGTRRISVVIEALRTQYFGYTASIYGY